MIKHFRDLDVYQRSQKLYPRIVQLSRGFRSDGFHLRDQMCRSANGIHANIAEGYGRSAAEFKMYLMRALGSCNETVSHLADAINANLCDKESSRELIAQYEIVGKQIYKLRENWKAF